MVPGVGLPLVKGMLTPELGVGCSVRLNVGLGLGAGPGLGLGLGLRVAAPSKAGVGGTLDSVQRPDERVMT